MSTTFRPIKDYPGYAIGEDGEVLSFHKGKITFRKRQFSKGYLQVNLRNSSGWKTFKVHFLVAQAFLGERPRGMVVDHKDGNKLNNHYSNLHYVTVRENVNNPNTLPTNNWHRRGRRVVAIKEGIEKTFDSVTQAGRELGVGPGNVYNCLKGKYYCHSLRGYTFRWADEVRVPLL